MKIKGKLLFCTGIFLLLSGCSLGVDNPSHVTTTPSQQKEEMHHFGLWSFLDDGTGHNVVDESQLTGNKFNMRFASLASQEMNVEIYLIVDGIIQDSIWKGRLLPGEEQSVELTLDNLIGRKTEEHFVTICKAVDSPDIYPRKETDFFALDPVGEKTLIIDEDRISEYREIEFEEWEKGKNEKPWSEGKNIRFHNNNDKLTSIINNDDINMSVYVQDAGDYLYALYADGKRIKTGYLHFDEAGCKTCNVTETVKGAKVIWANYKNLTDLKSMMGMSSRYLLVGDE